jgi:hypothetical protein
LRRRNRVGEAGAVPFEKDPMTEAPLTPDCDIDDRLRRCTGLANLRFDPPEAVLNLTESGNAPGDDEILSSTRWVLDPAREGLRR